MLHIPSVLAITDGQAEKAKEFYRKVLNLAENKESEECCSTSRIKFIVQDTSLCTNLWIHDERTGLTESLLTDEDFANL